MSYRIGSFNALKLGKNAGDVKIDHIAKIIRLEAMSIVALQEVFDEVSVKNLTKKVGFSWEYAFELSRDSKEGYAFLWDSQAWFLPVATAAGGQKRRFKPRILNQYCKFNGIPMVRNPYYARFIPAPNSGGPFIELRLINTHIRFSGSNNDVETDVDMSTLEKRRNEFRTLTHAVYPKYEDKIYGITDIDDYSPEGQQSAQPSFVSHDSGTRPAYTILMGDYNLNINNGLNPSPYLFWLESQCGERIEITDGNLHKVILTAQDAKTTLHKPKEDGSVDKDIYANNYDHFSYDEIRYKDAARIHARTVDAVTRYAGGDAVKYVKEISDHLPIIIDFEIIRRRED